MTIEIIFITYFLIDFSIEKKNDGTDENRMETAAWTREKRRVERQPRGNSDFGMRNAKDEQKKNKTIGNRYELTAKTISDRDENPRCVHSVLGKTFVDCIYM